MRGEPTIALEEVDSDEVVVRMQATPVVDTDGPRLADEVLSAVATVIHDVDGGRTYRLSVWPAAICDDTAPAPSRR